MEIKDYLHLYLGCEVIGYYKSVDDSTGKEVIVELQKQLLKVDVYGRAWLSGNVSVREFKPILRPLDSITEHELIELLKLVSLIDLSECAFESEINEPDTWINATKDGRIVDSLTLVGDHIQMMNNDGSFSNLNPVAPAIVWMLSKGFDLFGLIFNKLAIDSTTLTPAKS